MPMANLFPPGRVLWAVRDGDMEFIAPYTKDGSSGLESRGKNKNKDRLRLFEVFDVEEVFSQVVFARDMLRYRASPAGPPAAADFLSPQLPFASPVRPDT